jgi:hypothetical protein
MVAHVCHPSCSGDGDKEVGGLRTAQPRQKITKIPSQQTSLLWCCISVITMTWKPCIRLPCEADQGKKHKTPSEK